MNRYFLTFIGLCFVTLSFAQPIVDFDKTFPDLIDPLQAPTGTTVYRTHVFRILGDANLDDAVFKLQHQPVSGVTLQNIAFKRVDIYTNSTNPFSGATYNSFEDPAITYGLAPAIAEVPSSIGNPSPGEYDDGSTFLGMQTVATILTTPPVNIPLSHYVFIVESFEIEPCSPKFSETMTSQLDIEFSSNTISYNAQSFSQTGSLVQVKAAPIEWKRTYLPGSGPNQQHAFIDEGANCTNGVGNQIYREIKYELKGGALIDPQIRIDLNMNDFLGANYSNAVCLTEINKADFKIDLYLNTNPNNDGTLLYDKTVIGLDYMDFESIQGVHKTTNALVSSTIGYEREADNGMSISSCATTNPLVLEEVYDPLHSNLNSNWNKRPSSIAYIPSIGSNAGSGNCVVSQIKINLSNLDLNGEMGTDIDTKFDYDANIGNNDPEIRKLAFVTVFPGSYIVLRYTGNIIPQDLIHTDWKYMKDKVPNFNYERFVSRGFTECGGTLEQDIGGTQKVVMNPTLLATAPLPGNPDKNTNTWDGKKREFSIKLKAPGLSTMDHYINSMEMDYASSELEFELRLDRGLSVPCPCEAVAAAGINMDMDCVTAAANNFCNPTIPYTVNGLACTNLDISDIFRIDLGNDVEVVPSQIDILPLKDNDCMAGQIWRCTIPMSSFMAKNAVNKIEYLLENAWLRFNVQGYCTAAEPTSAYSLRLYLRPGICNANSFKYPANNILYKSDGTASDLRMVCCSNDAMNTDCISEASTSSCPENRFLVGKTDGGSVVVTCPGCAWPGANVNTNSANEVTQLRNEHFVGYRDEYDRGTADNPSSKTTAPLSEISRDRVRHGDVMSWTAEGTFLNGQTFTSENLSTGSGSACSPQIPAIVLNKWVYEIRITNGGGIQFRDVFYPLVVDGASSNNVLPSDDDLTQAEYQALINTGLYNSSVTFRSSLNPSHTIDIKAEHLVWIDTTLRLAFDFEDITGIGPGDANYDPDFYITEDVGAVFQLHFITDIDDPSVTWGEGISSPGLLLNFQHTMFATDTDIDELLGKSPFNAPKALTGSVADHCLASPDITWICEEATGFIYLVPYSENRYMENNFASNTSDFPKQYLQFVHDGLSSCSEVGPALVYDAGPRVKTTNKSSTQGNYFPHEVRPPAIPDKVTFYVPEPYEPAAIILEVNSDLNPIYYDGLTPEEELQTSDQIMRYVIPLTDYFTMIKYPGITVSGTPTEIMPTEMYPSYPAGSNYIGELPGAVQPASGYIFKRPSLTQRLKHYKVELPLYAEYDYTQFNFSSGTIHQFASVNGGDPANPDNAGLYPNAGPNGAFPIYVGDERIIVKAAIVYNMPVCDIQNHPYPFDEEKGAHFAENTSPIYYDGNPTHLLHIHGVESQNLQPVDIGYQLTNADYASQPNRHPDFSTQLVIPSVIRTGTPPNTPTTISTKVEGIDNHIVDLHPNLQAEFEGIVPASGQVHNGDPAILDIPLLFFDQRSNLEAKVFDKTSIEVDENSGEFTFQFELTNEVLDQFLPFVGPDNFFDPGTGQFPDFQSFLDATYTKLDNNNNQVPDVDRQKSIQRNFRFSKRNVDLNGLYFYLVPVAIDIDGVGGVNDQLDLATDIEILKVEGITKSSTGEYTFGNGVFAGTKVGGVTQPRLFSFNQMDYGVVNGGDVKNVNGRIVTVRGRFRCDNRPIMQHWLQSVGTGNLTTLEFPFNVVVNYNCDPGYAAWSSEQPPVPMELTLNYANDHRCSNDRIIEGLNGDGAYKLRTPLVGYSVTVTNESSACDRKFAVTLTNTNESALGIKDFVLRDVPYGSTPTISPVPGEPAGNAWTLSSAPSVGGTGTDWTFTATELIPLAVNGTISYEVDFGAVGCGIFPPYVLVTEAHADFYCIECPQSTCISETGTLEVRNDPAELGLLNFNDYYPFAGTNCIEIGANGQDVTVHLNPIFDGVNIETLPYAFPDGEEYEFFIKFQYGSQTIVEPAILNAQSLSTFFQGITFSGLFPQQPCEDVVVSIVNVLVRANCGGTNCVVASVGGLQSDPQRCTLNIPPPDIQIMASATTICEGEGVTLTASGGTAYTWNPVITNGVEFFPTLTQTYVVTGEGIAASGGGNGCEGSNEIEIVVKPAPQIAISSDESICLGENATISVQQQTDVEYSWDNGLGFGISHVVSPSVSTTYEVTADLNGCTDQATVNVTVSQNAYMGTNPITIPVCDFNNPVFLNASTLGSFDSYLWDDALATTTSTLQINDYGTYKVIVELANHCPTTIEYIVYPIIPDLDLPEKSCVGDPIGPTNTNLNVEYKWFDESGNEIFTGSSFTPSSPGWYTLKANVYAANCEKIARVRVYSLPHIGSFNVTVDCDNSQNVVIEPQGGGAKKWLKFEWEFDNDGIIHTTYGNQQNGMINQHFPVNGEHTFTVTITNTNTGCSVTHTQTLVVDCCIGDMVVIGSQVIDDIHPGVYIIRSMDFLAEISDRFACTRIPGCSSNCIKYIWSFTWDNMGVEETTEFIQYGNTSNAFSLLRSDALHQSIIHGLISAKVTAINECNNCTYEQELCIFPPDDFVEQDLLGRFEQNGKYTMCKGEEYCFNLFYPTNLNSIYDYQWNLGPAVKYNPGYSSTDPFTCFFFKTGGGSLFNYPISLTLTYPCGSRTYNFVVDVINCPTAMAPVEGSGGTNPTQGLDVLKVEAFPNPNNHGVYNISVHTESNLDDDVYYRIFNVYGQEIIKNKTNESRFVVDISNYARGVYFLEIQRNNQSESVKLIFE